MSKKTNYSGCNASRVSVTNILFLNFFISISAAVVIAFFISWAPFHAQRLLYYYGKDSPHFPEINAYMFFITGILYYFSSTVNPILYNVMSNRYRTAFRDVLCGRKANALKLSRRSTFRDTRVSSNCDALRLERESLSRAASQRESSKCCTTLVSVNGADRCLLSVNGGESTNGVVLLDKTENNLVSKIGFKVKNNSKKSNETYI